MESCQSITKVPDLWAPNLETLDISYCDNLIEIHDSIGLLDKLKCWNLSHCMKLRILPSTLKLINSFDLWACPSLEKFPNVHPETKCLGPFRVYDCNIREWPLSLRYLTEGIFRLKISECENLGKSLDSANKFLEGFDILPEFSLFGCDREISIDLDFCMKNDFFPALRSITIDDCNIVSIPECIFRLSKNLKGIYIDNCRKLREIQNPRLPQSIIQVEITKCPSLLPQSSSRLLNEFGKILGILPNRVSEGARSDILMDLFDHSESEFESDSEYESESESDSDFKLLSKDNFIFLPGTEIPKSLKFNHQSFGNSISFKVGCKFQIMAVCVAFRSAENRGTVNEIGRLRCRRNFAVEVFVNGWKQHFRHTFTEASYEELWLFSLSLGQLNKPKLPYGPYLFEQNRVTVEAKYVSGSEWLSNQTNYIKWLGVNVECICCPQKSDITYLPLPSDRNGCGSSSVLNDIELPPFQPVFPTSYGLKGFLGDLNVSLSTPNNSELLALLPGPNMDPEVSNSVNDFRLLKGIHNNGYDLSLSLNDSNERESEPPLFPNLTNGFDFGFAQPNLELGSGVSSGFHLGSSSMAHASVNDDSGFYMGSSSMAHASVNDDSGFYMGSSSMAHDCYQPVFPTSYGLKGCLGDLNLSLSAPNNSELLALLPGPNMDPEVSNSVNDFRLLKGIHNNGYDLSLSLNDSNERESEPPLFPNLTNGFDFGFAQPNLELGSGVSSGFHLGLSSMAHASVNDDSDFYMGSSSMAHDCYQPVFPTSYGLKGCLGDLNLSLSAPNNSELLALLPSPNMDPEVSNSVNDFRLLKGIHNNGYDLSLSLNDSNERESEPPLFPNLTNGFDFGFAQPNLELGSGVSSGFHLGSSSMAHASVNDDSDFYMGSSSMAHDCYQPVFPTSYGLKGYLGNLNLSLSAPNNSELLALLLGPNMDHEVSNTVNDLRLLKGNHNDGCDSNERESEPPLFPDSTNEFDFDLAQPNLDLGSSVCGGFHLGSSSMAHACVNDDSDFNMGPPPTSKSLFP